MSCPQWSPAATTDMDTSAGKHLDRKLWRTPPNQLWEVRMAPKGKGIFGEKWEQGRKGERKKEREGRRHSKTRIEGSHFSASSPISAVS